MGTLAEVHGAKPKLPRGRARLPAPAVRSAHRERLHRAVIAVVAAKGYAALTVNDIVDAARVSKQAFYEHFSDKEDCFVSASEEGCELMFSRVSAAARSVPADAAPPERLRAALHGYLRFLADEPEFARTFYLEILAAGPRALARRVAVHERFAELTRRWHQRARAANTTWPEVPDEAYLAMVGSIYELAAKYVRENRLDQITRLADPLLDLHLAVFAGRPATPL